MRFSIVKAICGVFVVSSFVILPRYWKVTVFSEFLGVSYLGFGFLLQLVLRWHLLSRLGGSPHGPGPIGI